MNKEQYENVERFKPQFNLAKTGFVRVSRGDLDIIRRTYNEVYGKSLQPGNMNCNSCVLKMMKAMGEAVEKYEASQTPEAQFADAMETFNAAASEIENEIKSEMKEEPVEEESDGFKVASPVESDGFKVEVETSPENQEEPKAEPSRAQILAAKLREKNEAKKKRGRPKKNS